MPRPLALSIPQRFPALLGPNGLGESVLRWSLSHGVRIVIIVATTYVLSRAARRLVSRLEQRLRTEDAEAGRSPQRSKTFAEASRTAVMMVAGVIASLRAPSPLRLDLTPHI